MLKILIIDNYDSFTNNLAHLFSVAGAKVAVHFPEDPQILKIGNAMDGIVFSPGPSHPAKAMQTKAIFEHYYKIKPLFGVCLGMQIFNEALGGSTIRAAYPVHGKTARININPDSCLFRGVPNHLTVARYHSLICKPIAEDLKAIASYNNIVMALENTKHKLYGVQFHPESFLSSGGLQIIQNFLKVCE